jgi:hypothetical protein
MTSILADTTTDFLSTRASRLFAFGGIFLIVAGMLLGDVFAIFILHPNNARIGETMYAAAMAIPSGDADTILGYFQAIGGFLENRGTKVAAHTHAIAIGYLAVMFAILQPVIGWSAEAKVRLAWTFVLSATLLPFAIFTIHYAGLAFSPLSYIGWASIVADIVGLLVAIVVTLQLVGLWRHFRSGGAAGPLVPALGAPGRLLLAGGSLLLLAGFFYGAGYAAYIEYRLHPGEVEILRNIVSNAAAGQSVDADFGAFGGLLAFQGIHRATHAHVNTMGLLLLLFALVQPYVFLSEVWKKRWARVLVIASFALPICIVLEFRFGLIAGGAADISGGIAIAAILAFLFGLVRHTGVRDDAAKQ